MNIVIFIAGAALGAYMMRNYMWKKQAKVLLKKAEEKESKE